MPEGDTLRRTADVLGRALVGEEVARAWSRPVGPQLIRVEGSRVSAVRNQGKHLLIDFDLGLTLHTHLGMHGSWHRYRPGERWRRPRGSAVAMLETGRTVAVCFDAPVVELLDTRALALHPSLAALGPDLLAEPPDIEAAVARLRAAERAEVSVAEALLDQRAVAGIGNVYRSEVLWQVSLPPLLPVGELDDATLRSVLATAAALMRANLTGGQRVTTRDALGAAPGSDGQRRGMRRLNVYGRTGRPCPRCASLIRSGTLGSPPRRVYWCPRCQAQPV